MYQMNGDLEMYVIMVIEIVKYLCEKYPINVLDEWGFRDVCYNGY